MSVNVSFPRTSQLMVLALALALSTTAWAAKETVLYSFPQDGSTGNYPEGALVADKAGNLYGTTNLGGVNNPPNCYNASCGTVFELSPPSEPGGPWIETVLYEFQGGADGGRSTCTLVIDEDGNLYGTSAYYISSDDYGLAVWELSPPSQPGGSWTESTLYNFPGMGGGTDAGALLRDSAGNFYGTSEAGGDSMNCGKYGCGAVFEVSPPTQPGGTWGGAILHSFDCTTDGTGPVGSLVFDNKGALYGVTTGDDYPCGYGTVFKLAPPSQPAASWTETVLYTFSGGTDGGNPYAGLVFDRKGNLYGTTGYGGLLECDFGRQRCGNVFELVRPSSPSGPWAETVLYNFTGKKTGDGQYPVSNLIMDGQGDLYGTTIQGGKNNAGTVFELSPPSLTGGFWVEKRFPLGSDDSGDSYHPIAGLIFGPGKAVSGTATGEFEGGGVFTISR